MPMGMDLPIYHMVNVPIYPSGSWGCILQHPVFNLIRNGFHGLMGVRAVFLRRRSPVLSSRSEREQKVLCALATPEPALQASTTVPLVTAEPGSLGDGSVPCHELWGCSETGCLGNSFVSLVLVG